MGCGWNASLPGLTERPDVVRALPRHVCVSKSRFDKTEATIHNGEDLDIQTYVRRGVCLN
jgi:hypothetical protein